TTPCFRLVLVYNVRLTHSDKLLPLLSTHWGASFPILYIQSHHHPRPSRHQWPFRTPCPDQATQSLATLSFQKVPAYASPSPVDNQKLEHRAELHGFSRGTIYIHIEGYSPPSLSLP